MKNRGFTLLEVLIALAIVGGLVAAVLGSVQHHLQALSRHESITVATLLAREKLAQLKGRPKSAKGAFAEPFTAYNYDVKVQAGPYPGLGEIAVEVWNAEERIVLKDLFIGTVPEGNE